MNQNSNSYLRHKAPDVSDERQRFWSRDPQFGEDVKRARSISVKFVLLKMILSVMQVKMISEVLVEQKQQSSTQDSRRKITEIGHPDFHVEISSNQFEL